jgi:hypothetical protein
MMSGLSGNIRLVAHSIAEHSIHAQITSSFPSGIPPERGVPLCWMEADCT